MCKYSILIGLAAGAALSSMAADTKDDKSALPISVKVSLDKPEPSIPVKLALPPIAVAFCIKGGLDSNDEPIRRDRLKCPYGMERVGANADDIVSQLGKATEYTVTKADNFHILVFCNAKVCDAAQNRKMEATIQELAKPSPRYWEDFNVPDKVDPKELASAVPKMAKGVKGRIIAEKLIRVETDRKLDPVELASLKNQIKNADSASLKKLSPPQPDVNGKRILLPFFCVSKNLDGPPPVIADDKEPCEPDRRKIQGSNAPSIAGALTSDKLKVTADSANSLVIACGTSKCDSDALDLLTASINTMARPVPSYVQERPVLAQTANSAANRIREWSGGAITAEVVSDSLIRLKSDVPVPNTDIARFRDRLLDEGFGYPKTLPAKQLFYCDAATVV